MTPPLRHAERVLFAVFNASGDRLATRSRDGKAFLWDLTPESREVAELALLGQLLNSRQIDSSGGALPIDTTKLENIWQHVRTASAGVLHTPVETIAAWHEREASECETTHRWFAALFHLRRLAELNPMDAGVTDRLASAQAALQQGEQDRAKARTFAKPQQAPKP